MAEFRIERRERLEIWTIDGEVRRNAISRAMLSELGELVAKTARTDTPDAPRVVVLTGAGERAFCAGADLKERATMEEAEVRAFLDGLRETFRAIERSPATFIAAINGAAFGGGTELALACDLRVAAPASELGLTEVRLGIIPGGGGTQRLARLIGPGRAKDLILTGRRASAAEAFALGIVNRLAPEGRLLETAVTLGEEILKGGPVATAAAKHAIDEGFDLPLDEGLALEQQKYELVLNTEDRLEGLRAFKEKRPPKFQGR